MPCEIFKGPIVDAVDVVRHLHEQAPWDLLRFDAVFHAKVATFVMIGGIQFTARIGARAERGTRHFLTSFSLHYNIANDKRI
jgi:hypothetical protein